jgi:hypothetical protein
MLTSFPTDTIVVVLVLEQGGLCLICLIAPVAVDYTRCTSEVLHTVRRRPEQ